jgi:hypothetical protein
VFLDEASELSAHASFEEGDFGKRRAHGRASFSKSGANTPSLGFFRLFVNYETGAT